MTTPFDARPAHETVHRCVVCGLLLISGITHVCPEEVQHRQQQALKDAIAAVVPLTQRAAAWAPQKRHAFGCGVYSGAPCDCY